MPEHFIPVTVRTMSKRHCDTACPMMVKFVDPISADDDVYICAAYAAACKKPLSVAKSGRVNRCKACRDAAAIQYWESVEQ